MASLKKFPPVLDPCCGGRMFWFDKKNPLCLFGDIRYGIVTMKDTSHGNPHGQRVLRIEPDIPMDFRDMPFPSNTFSLAVFDPPHLVRAGPKSWAAAKYGLLEKEWENDLRKGFKECFRVLKPRGVLIFKWSETQIPLKKILSLAVVPPLFGHVSGKRSGTHWVVFLKEAKKGRG